MWLSFLVVLDGLTLTLIGFVRFLGPPGSKEAKNGVPIVQLMFLYEARARARASYRNISCTIGNPFWHDWDQEGSKT